MRWLLLFAALLAAPSQAMTCQQYALYGGGVVVERKHGATYQEVMAKAAMMPVKPDVRRMLLGITSFAYRIGRPAEHVMIAIKRSCEAKPTI